jgi:hypothetical protein
MDRPFSHLNEKAQLLLDSPDAERIETIQRGSWIPYTRAREVLDHMEELFAYPRIERMPHMLLVGASNNGKTQILTRFMQQHPADPNPQGECSVIPVVMVEAPSAPDVGDFYDRIFKAINQPYSPRAPVREKEAILFHVLERVQLKMLLIDEIQHVIAGGQTRQREFRNALKSLGNILKISIVGAGVEEAFNAFNTDPQLSNRFEPEFLPKWKFDNEFGILLNTLERRTPLMHPSGLQGNEIARKIYYMSEGVMGEIHEIVKRAAVHAIRSKDERITLETLEKIRWTQPSKRKTQPHPG